MITVKNWFILDKKLGELTDIPVSMFGQSPKIPKLARGWLGKI